MNESFCFLITVFKMRFKNKEIENRFFKIKTSYLIEGGKKEGDFFR
jgi:hypothetical protein